MRRLLFTIAIGIGLCLGAVPRSYAQEARDTSLAPALDSTLVGKSIFIKKGLRLQGEDFQRQQAELQRGI